MSENDDRIAGVAEGGPSVRAELVPGPDADERGVPKPPRRVDTLVNAVVQLGSALELIGRSLDEGPLRTACIKAATQAIEIAKSAYYSRRPAARQADSRRERPDNDARAVPVPARARYTDRKRRR